MSIAACTISLIFMVISIMFKRTKSIKPSTIFFALWFFILFLSSLNLFNIFEPSNETCFLIILMLVFFFIGSLFGNKFRINFYSAKGKKMVKGIKIRYVIFYTLSFFMILFCAIDCIILIKELMKGTPMWQIRNWGLEPFGSENPILSRRSFLEDAFRTIILSPFGNLVPPITAYMFFNSNNKKEKYILLVNSLAILVLSSIAGGGGRLGFIYYVGCFILAFYIFCRDSNKTKTVIRKYLKIIIIFVIVAILFVVGYTTVRNGFGKLFEEIYTYFALPPTLLSEWLPEIKESTHTYGLLSTFGIHSYFFRALDMAGLDSLVPQIYNEAYQHILNAEIFRNVGYGIANAFVTPIYYWYIDGGYTFVCLASLFLGWLISDVHCRVEKNINLKSFTIYALITYGVFLSFIRIQTAIPSYIISFILIWVLLKPIIKKEKEDNDENLQ